MKGCGWGENPHCDGESRAAREGRDAARRFEGFYLLMYVYKSYEPGFFAILSYPMMSLPCGLPHLRLGISTSRRPNFWVLYANLSIQGGTSTI